jgi:predicted transcriptional regulator of viral defense system
VDKRKTETGYAYVSSPELTAADLVYYQNRIGGLNKVCLVINELSETIKAERITPEFIDILSTPTIQRLGYIFDKIVSQSDLAEKIYNVSQEQDRTFFLQPFRTGGERKGYSINEKWKIIINTSVRIEE